MIDTVALQDHLHIIQEKQRNARNLIEQLNQICGYIQPELQQDCCRILRNSEEFLRYFREQEAMLQEMSNRYEAASRTVSDMLEEAVHIAENIY